MMVRILCIIAVLVFPLRVSAESSIDAFGPGSSAPEGGLQTEAVEIGLMPEAPVVAAEDLGPEDKLLLRSLQEESVSAQASAVAGGEFLLLASSDNLRKESGEAGDNHAEGGSEAGEGENTRIADPLYYWNVAMYHFNDKLYFWLLKPAAQGYSAVTPEPIRLAVSHFFENLTTPIRFVGNLLQLKLKNAGDELVRFVTNSTQGVAGLFDVAKSHYGISGHKEDIGQALGSYGIGHGFYLVWPFFGPSSLRDTVGLVGDLLLDPVTYVTPLEASIGIRAYDRVNETTFRIGDYEELKEAAIDPYVAIRNGYVQKRKKEVEE